MMKSRLFPVLFVLLCTFFNGQSTDLDRFYFSTKEVRLPQKFTDAEKRTYSVKVSENIIGVEINPTNFYLNGFKINEENPTYNFEIKLSTPINYSDPEILYRQEVKKDKDGKVTSTTDYYKVVQNIEASGKCFLNGEHYSTFRHSDRFSTLEYPTSKMARENFMIQKYTWNDNFNAAFQKSAYSQTNEHINKELGYSLRKSDINLWLLGSKKHPEYENHQSALQTIRNAFAKVEYNKIPEGFSNEIAPAISIFENQMKTFAEDNKKNKKVRYAAYYNLMKIYFNSEDLENAAKYANLLIANDYDKKDGKDMLESIDIRRKLLAISNTNTTHFDVQNETKHTIN